MSALRSPLLQWQIMNGDTSDYWIHLKGCNQLQKSRHFSNVVSLPTQQLNSISSFLGLLALTTSHKFEPLPWPCEGSPFSKPLFRADEKSIEYMYGITLDLANALQRTCDLAQYLEFYSGKIVPPTLLEACEDLGDELATWKIDNELFSTIDPGQTAMLDIARCQARAWHSSILIFYYRTIRMCNPTDLEDDRKIVLKNLTVAETLKDQFLKGKKQAAPITWPAFMAACEATDREPWIEWWNKVNEGYRIGNFSRQWRIIQEMWGVIDTDVIGIHWRDVLIRLDTLVLAI
jgi:arginine metabolism regulation protein II